ncbi:MAG TPA: tolB protein [Elusimicrobiota bacterium]|jgi:TolB protein|nr:tolB protein [Elusimicrobiota bacterium]
MSPRRPLLIARALALPLACVLAPASTPRAASADTPDGQQPPDESILGTVDVNGSATEGLPPLPKMAVVPIVPTGSADSLVNLVVRHDMELSGQFEVLGEDVAPAGPFTHTTPLDLGAWRDKGAEYVLRIYSQPGATDSTKTELVGEAFVTPTAAQAAAQRARAAAAPPDAVVADPKPSFRAVVPTATTEVRAASHRLVDQILGALTGRPGGFASEMTYAEKVGRWRRIFTIDSDGFDLRALGPDSATAISPSFGPGGQVFYALSDDYSPFRLVEGPNATPVPVNVPGSIMGLAFSADHSRMALTVMDSGQSKLWYGARDKLQPMNTAPLANHPVFGPMDKIAYVAGTPVQRIFVGERAISPPGFMASAPVFCDTPQGLLVIYTVGVGAGADIIATDSGGGGLKRLTQHEGANTYAACSPDGRLVAFFSTGKRKLAAGESAASAGHDDTGAGLYIMPIQRPWLAKKISSEVGESLRWEALPPVAAK